MADCVWCGAPAALNKGNTPSGYPAFWCNNCHVDRVKESPALVKRVDEITTWLRRLRFRWKRKVPRFSFAVGSGDEARDQIARLTLWKVAENLGRSDRPGHWTLIIRYQNFEMDGQGTYWATLYLERNAKNVKT